MPTPKMNKHFHYRTVAVLTNDTHVLLHTTQEDDFWTLPGGHVEWGETAQKALVREFFEETGYQISLGRLLWVVESFFAYKHDLHHEIGFYFQVQLAENSPILASDSFYGVEIPESGQGNPLQLEFRWHLRQQQLLKQLPVYPVFLQKALVHLPEHCTHILNHEIEDF